MMPRKLLVLLAAIGLAASVDPPLVTARASAVVRQASAGGLGDRFIGTWKLVNIETRNAKGEVVAPAGGSSQTPTGYIIYDPAGYMAVSIMPKGRKKYVGAQPTDEEALAALGRVAGSPLGYVAYFGTFTVNEKEQYVTHHLQGSLSAAMAANQQRFFELSGNRLTLKPPPNASGNQMRLTWERLPDLSNMSAEQRKFVGFWKLVSNERRTDKGESVSSNPGQFGYIIYTAAGFMMVHMVQPDRKPYAGPQPTPAEARQTLRTYTNYFGPFYVHEEDGYVVHDQYGSLSAGRASPSPQQRYYRFVGNRLLLQPPRAYNADNSYTEGTITWEKAVAAAGAP